MRFVSKWNGGDSVSAREAIGAAVDSEERSGALETAEARIRLLSDICAYIVAQLSQESQAEILSRIGFRPEDK